MAADKVHNATQSIVGDIKSGLHGIHGAGEAIRGGAMEALDGVFHKKEGEARDRAIYEQGVTEMRGTEDRFESKQLQSHHTVGNHHDHTGHGQGSHFAGTHARDVSGTSDHAATNRAEEAESLGAAKTAW